MEQLASSASGSRFDGLRRMLYDSFPERICSGPITPVDGDWTEELDDDRTLYDCLIGRHWREIPPQVMWDQPDGYVLLTEQAFAAFLPCWLSASLEDRAEAKRIREFLIFSFSQSAADLPDDAFASIAAKLRVLSLRQREALRAFLAEFGSTDTSESVRNQAQIALAQIDSLG